MPCGLPNASIQLALRGRSEAPAGAGSSLPPPRAGPHWFASSVAAGPPVQAGADSSCRGIAVEAGNSSETAGGTLDRTIWNDTDQRALPLESWLEAFEAVSAASSIRRASANANAGSASQMVQQIWCLAEAKRAEWREWFMANPLHETGIMKDGRQKNVLFRFKSAGDNLDEKEGVLDILCPRGEGAKELHEATVEAVQRFWTRGFGASGSSRKESSSEPAPASRFLREACCTGSWPSLSGARLGCPKGGLLL
jgi:hypothetical protein